MMKCYYKLVFRLVSPLALSSGMGKKTDADVLLNSFGRPFIPASAIAGALSENLSENLKKKLFGFVEGENLQASYIVTYDGNTQDDFHLSIRDGVALNEQKVAVKGAKYDFEIVEPGIKFVTYFEISDINNEVNEDAMQLIENIHSLKMGAKTTRGYGNLQLKEIYKKTFVFSTKCSAQELDEQCKVQKSSEQCKADEFTNLKNWLDFDLFASNAFHTADQLANPKEITGRDRNKLELKLKIIGSPVIRRYTANVSEDENYPEPDYESLTVIEGKDKKIPVIPGTSWAGAFRSHIEKMAKEMGIFPPNTAEKNRLGLAFGYVDKKTACAVKSKITFSESKIKDSEAKLMTRTAIDRFSGGTVEGSLYTERIWYGGTTDLCIEFDGGIDEYVKQLLACAVLDLDAGILSVGGETSVGHGIFKIDEFVLNGQVITQFNPQSLTKNNDVGGGISEQ